MVEDPKKPGHILGVKACSVKIEGGRVVDVADSEKLSAGREVAAAIFKDSFAAVQLTQWFDTPLIAV